MSKHKVSRIFMVVWCCSLALTGCKDAEKEKAVTVEGPPHQESPPGGWSGILNPNTSVVADVIAFFSSDTADPNRNKVLVREVEFAFQGYLYPGIRADIIPAMEMMYTDEGVEFAL